MKTDFADWCSPMLVKELRQGVRGRAFVSTFIILQGAMLLNVMMGLLTSSTDGPESSTIFFWVLVGVSVLLVLPLGGLNSVGGEIKANTLELIFLTRLTALRIIAGKWLAVFAQSALLVSAVLPYLVLRYFIGGVNLSNELIILAVMLGTSAVFTAITIGLSPYLTVAVRMFAAVAVVVVIIWGAAGPIFLFTRVGGGGGGGMSAWQVIPFVACAAILLVLMLDIGASKIAPGAENHAIAKRTLAVAAFLVALGADFLPGASAGVTGITFLLANLICAGALCEQPRWIPSIYRPFVRRGVMGRILGRLLCPGWFSGVLFTTGIYLAFGALLAHQKLLGTTPELIALISAFGTLMLPVALIRFFFSKTERPGPLFSAVQILCLVLLLVCVIVDGALHTYLRDVLTFLPLCSLCNPASDEWHGWDFRLLGVTVVTLVSWLAALGLSLRPYRQMRATERAVLPPPIQDASLA